MSGGWAAIVEKHVVPVDDLREHVTDVSCWCGPTPDDEDPHIYVHHAADKRELFEGLPIN